MAILDCYISLNIVRKKLVVLVGSWGYVPSSVKYLRGKIDIFLILYDNQLYSADYKIFDFKFVLPMKKPRSRVIFITALAAQPVQTVKFMFSNRLIV